MGKGGEKIWESVLRSCRDRKALKKSEARILSPGLTLRGGQTYCEGPAQKCSVKLDGGGERHLCST